MRRTSVTGLTGISDRRAELTFRLDAESPGSGKHRVVIEYNCSSGISMGTIYRPAESPGALSGSHWI